MDYRLRILREIEVKTPFGGVQRLQEWNTYSLPSPLTSLNQAIAQANAAFSAASYNSAASIVDVLDVAIEAI